MHPKSKLDIFLDRLLCFIGIHDWRMMNGTCCLCGKIDKFWYDNELKGK